MKLPPDPNLAGFKILRSCTDVAHRCVARELRSCTLSAHKHTFGDHRPEMNMLAVMMLVAGAMAGEDHAGHDHGGGGSHGAGKEECSCAQHEADHPFTIDCDNGPAIRAATLTLESDACEKPRPSDVFEWGGAFETPGDSYKWVSQAATGTAGAETYADAEMKMVLYSMTEAAQSTLFMKKEDADTLMTTGPCPAPTGDSIPAPTAAGACYTLTFPTVNQSTTDFHLTIATAGVDHVAFFTAHMPTEFERDTHYLMGGTACTAANMASATGGTTVANCAPAEPAEALGAEAAHDHGRRLAVATKGAKGVTNRKSIGKRRLVNAGACCDPSREHGASEQGAWKQVVAYRDLCEHDQVPEQIEKGFHDYRASCENYFCNLIGPDVDQTKCVSCSPQDEEAGRCVLQGQRGVIVRLCQQRQDLSVHRSWRCAQPSLRLGSLRVHLRLGLALDVIRQSDGLPCACGCFCVCLSYYCVS